MSGGRPDALLSPSFFFLFSLCGWRMGFWGGQNELGEETEQRQDQAKTDAGMVTESVWLRFSFFLSVGFGKALEGKYTRGSRAFDF